MNVSMEWFLRNLEDLKYVTEVHGDLDGRYQLAFDMLKEEIFRLEKLESGGR